LESTRTKGDKAVRISALATFALVAALTFASGSTAAGSDEVLRVTPPAVKFGTKPVGTFTLKGARVANVSSSTVNVIVTILAEPDDFSFGILPGSTCPVFGPAPLEAGAACDAVVGFRPSEFFAGHEQVASLLVTATDPVSGAVLDTETIDFTGRGKNVVG
jgi:hypothetical protein